MFGEMVKRKESRCRLIYIVPHSPGLFVLRKRVIKGVGFVTAKSGYLLFIIALP